MARFNPNNSRHLSRLVKARDGSRKALQSFRENRLTALRSFVGHHYSEDGSTTCTPINLIELAASIYTRALAPKPPRLLVKTAHAPLKSQATLLSMAVNHLADAIDLQSTYRRAVADALFGMGIIKVGLCAYPTAPLEGFRHAQGQPYLDNVDADDWVHDMSARRYESVGFAGNRYRLPFEAVQQAEQFDPAVRAKLTPTAITSTNPEGDERSTVLSQGDLGDDDEFEDHVELWDLWLPQDKLLVTLAAEGPEEPLRVIEWDGPAFGPFRLLCFEEVPGQILPLPPVALWRDLHDTGNIIFSKLKDQAERQKTIVGYAGAAAKDAERLVSARDGEAILMNNPERIKEYRFGGADNIGLAFLLQVKDLFSWFAGNLDALGGLSPQADTLGQDQLLNANASKRLSAMEEVTSLFELGGMRDLAWYLFTDPLIDLPMTKRIPGTSIEVPVSYRAEDRSGDFLDYNFQLVPYSQAEQTPAQRLQTLQQVFAAFIAPFAGQLQQQGHNIDFEALLKLVGQLTNMPEFEEFLQFADSGQTPDWPGPVGQPPTKSPVTTRNYVRTNRSGATRAGKDQALMGMLMTSGKGIQPAAAATLGRPVG